MIFLGEECHVLRQLQPETGEFLEKLKMSQLPTIVYYIIIFWIKLSSFKANRVYMWFSQGYFGVICEVNWEKIVVSYVLDIAILYITGVGADQ